MICNCTQMIGLGRRGVITDVAAMLEAYAHVNIQQVERGEAAELG